MRARISLISVLSVALLPMATSNLWPAGNGNGNGGKIVWPKDYVLQIERPVTRGNDSKNYLSGVVQNLIADQLFLQRSAITRGKLAPESIEYSLQLTHEALPENERASLLARYPKPAVLPLRIRRDLGSPKLRDRCDGAREGQYTLSTEVDASASHLKLKVLLCQGAELILTQRAIADEQELVAAVTRLVNPVRATLTGDSYSTLRIESNPGKASVYLDDQFLGKTPLDYSYLIPGEYRLVLKLDGYRSASEPISAQAGQKLQRSFTLAESPAGGSIDITTKPPGARIYLDADYHGKTPKKIERVAAGTYRLHLLHPEKGEVYRSIILTEKNGNLKIDEELNGFLADRQSGMLGITYKTWYYASLGTAATFFAAGIVFYVWRDQAQEQIFGRLSGKSASQYSQDDQDFLAARNSEIKTRGSYATAFTVTAGVFAALSIYFYVQHLLSQDEGIVRNMKPAEGQVQYHVGGTVGSGSFSASFRF